MSILKGSAGVGIVVFAGLVAMVNAQPAKKPGAGSGTGTTSATGSGSATGSAAEGSGSGSSRGSGTSATTNKTLDDIRDGKLSRYGITAGASIAAQIPIKSGTDAKPVISAMPYIQFMPLIYVVSGHIARSYCVAQVLEGKSAQEAADGAALSEAGFASAHIESSEVITAAQHRRLENALNYSAIEQSSVGMKVRALYPKTDDGKREADDLIGRIEKLKGALSQPITADSFEHKDQLDLVVALIVFETNGWWLGAAASGCGWRYAPGFYVGLPAKFNANTNVPSSDGGRTSAEFKPVISFGVAFSFTSFAQLMIGFTVSDVVDSKKQNTSIWSGTIGFGGNLDILGALFGK
jgi:hypothetical protein